MDPEATMLAMLGGQLPEVHTPWDGLQELHAPCTYKSLPLPQSVSCTRLHTAAHARCNDSLLVARAPNLVVL